MFTKDNTPKLVAECTYPLTGVRCVTRVYTDYGVFDVSTDGFRVRELFGDNTVTELESLTGLTLTAPSLGARR